MHFLWSLVIGLIVGAIAKFLMPGQDPGGIIVTMLLGVAGSFLGTLIGRAIGLYGEGRSAGFVLRVAEKKVPDRGRAKLDPAVPEPCQTRPSRCRPASAPAKIALQRAHFEVALEVSLDAVRCRDGP